MAITTDRLPKAIANLENTREALVNEIAASAGKARIHAKTLAEVQKAIDILKAESPKVATKAPAKSTKKKTEDK